MNTTSPRTSRLARLSRQEWTLVVLGVGVWLGLAFGGVWFVRQFTRSTPSCGGEIEARTTIPKGQSTGPRNALQLLTGTGRCK